MWPVTIYPGHIDNPNPVLLSGVEAEYLIKWKWSSNNVMSWFLETMVDITLSTLEVHQNFFLKCSYTQTSWVLGYTDFTFRGTDLEGGGEDSPACWQLSHRPTSNKAFAGMQHLQYQWLHLPCLLISAISKVESKMF